MVDAVARVRNPTAETRGLSSSLLACHCLFLLVSLSLRVLRNDRRGFLQLAFHLFIIFLFHARASFFFFFFHWHFTARTLKIRALHHSPLLPTKKPPDVSVSAMVVAEPTAMFTQGRLKLSASEGKT